MLNYIAREDASHDASNTLIDRLPGFLQRRTQGRWRRFSERQAWRKADRTQLPVFHYLYPENTCFDPQEFKRDRKILLSCHQPVSVVERRLASDLPYPLLNGLRVANAVVVLGPAELEIYRTQAPQARVEFIPHGIDSEWFHPGGGSSGRQSGTAVKKVFTGGNWLRDYKTWAEVVNLAARDNLAVRFTILANSDTLAGALAMLSDKARGIVDALHGVSDERLREIYRESDLVFLPLLDATANNVVLEALACGCPLLVSRLPATLAYAESAAKYFDSGDSCSVYEQVGSLLKDEDSLREMALSGRQRVEESLAWPKVMARHRSLLD